MESIKDLDFRLVFNKNLSEILQSSSLGSGPDEVGQKKYSTYDVTHKKSKTKKHFFIADSKTWQVFWRLEQLSNAFGARVMPTQSMCKQLDF